MTESDVVEVSEDEVPDDGGDARDPEGEARRTRRRDRSLRRWSSPVDGAPVVGFTGANGAGKTLLAVSDAIQDMRAGRPVVSTVQIDCDAGRSIPLRSLRELLDLRDTTVLLDEVSTMFSSRNTMNLPSEVVTFLQTMRHQGVTLRWTAPAWSRADVLIREVTQVYVGVRPLIRRRVAGEFWPRPVLAAVGVLDCVDVATDANPETVLKRRIVRPQLLPGWGAYDTYADAVRIGWHVQSGSCIDCGGTIPREKCSPERHERLGIEVA